jgi:multisubunit Na+/H+ antiporter MnhB subunit
VVWKLALVLIVANLAAILYRIRRPRDGLRPFVMASVGGMSLGFALLSGAVLPPGTLSSITQGVFLLTSLTLLVLEIRGDLRDWRGKKT